MFGEILTIWGCVPEITTNCIDMTNAASTYVGILIGGIMGGIISWWIYNRQKKTSDKEDEVLQHIQDLEENNELVLKKIEYFEENNEKLLKNIFQLEKKIDSIIEKTS